MLGEELAKLASGKTASHLAVRVGGVHEVVGPS
jgi:hypothetical protein